MMKMINGRKGYVLLPLLLALVAGIFVLYLVLAKPFSFLRPSSDDQGAKTGDVDKYVDKKYVDKTLRVIPTPSSENQADLTAELDSMIFTDVETTIKDINSGLSDL